ncbi:YdeI family protein [Belliella kenyensis]|uniref:YdeI family protein n=1 Tax=Belliella kenyensis TaxID=1472724 RepID=A0ABV8ENA5_9BACT|nr:YdeI/OmpD-associated family protein [Belliella kenyensis]MCH7400881.1 YdeI/OmpD-associated family protein [Belliella kenyensis]MDN3601833.1 YdeI/OmpD-associated family protein [Belliella kenyensis]
MTIETKIYYPKTKKDWRLWLEQHHQSEQSVWLVYYTKKSNKPTISWSDAVDVALCFGWIDSKKVKIDEETSHQFFSKRKPKSTWSKINKEKIKKLTEQGLMTEEGYKSIEIAKENGSWTILDEVEELIIPEDLEQMFLKYPGSKDFFLSVSKSVRKMMLQWIVLAKRPETRQNRIIEIVENASQNRKPKHMR